MICKFLEEKVTLILPEKIRKPIIARIKGKTNPTITKSTTEVIPIPTSFLKLINISHKAMTKKSNNPELNMNNKVK